MQWPLDAAFSGPDQGQVTGLAFIFMNGLGCGAVVPLRFPGLGRRAALKLCLSLRLLSCPSPSSVDDDVCAPFRRGALFGSRRGAPFGYCGARQGDAGQSVEAKLASELESARAALANEPRAAAEARSALEAERERCAELERTLDGERRGGGRSARTARAEETLAERRPDRDGEGGGQEAQLGGGEGAGGRRVSQREIARRLNLNRRTVARLVAADAPAMTQLLREHGYQGSVDLVRRRLRRIRSRG